MIYALVVIYNKACSESVTCHRLLCQSCTCFHTLLFDNSIQEFGNREYCFEHGWTYLGGNGNQGLSKAYNAAICFLKCHNSVGFLCLLDDDTSIPDDYIEQMTCYTVQQPDADILVPILYQNGRIISPCKLSASKRKRYFPSVGACMDAPTNSIQAFNSGMLVSLKVYDQFQYDERIFVDGVDHAFLKEMKTRQKNIVVVPSVCQHGFSGGQQCNKFQALTRFKIYARDSLILYEDNISKYYSIVGRRALRLCVQHKSLIFIFEWFRVLFASHTSAEV